MQRLDDWTQPYIDLAAKQGWQVLVADFYWGNETIEIKSTTELDDSAAITAFKAAYLRKEDHAMLAFRLIKEYNLAEYRHWEMETWKR